MCVFGVRITCGFLKLLSTVSPGGLTTRQKGKLLLLVPEIADGSGSTIGALPFIDRSERMTRRPPAGAEPGEDCLNRMSERSWRLWITTCRRYCSFQNDVGTIISKRHSPDAPFHDVSHTGAPAVEDALTHLSLWAER